VGDGRTRTSGSRLRRKKSPPERETGRVNGESAKVLFSFLFDQKNAFREGKEKDHAEEGLKRG